MMRLKPFQLLIQKSMSLANLVTVGRKHIELARSGKGFKNMPNFALVDINSTNVAQIRILCEIPCPPRFCSSWPSCRKFFFGPFLTRGSAALVSGYASAYLPCRWAN